MSHFASSRRMGRQGLPAASTPAGMSRTTTEPAPMTVLSPLTTASRSNKRRCWQSPVAVVEQLVERYGVLNDVAMHIGFEAVGRDKHDVDGFSGVRLLDESQAAL